MYQSGNTVYLERLVIPAGIWSLPNLHQKLADNALRRKRETLLSTMTAPLGEILGEADYLLSSDIAQVIGQWFWPSSVSSNGPAEGRPSSWTLTDFDNLAGLGRTAGLVQMPATEGYLWLDREAPIFRIDCSVWNTLSWHIMDTVSKGDSAHLAVVAEDNTRGLLISEYVGYLPKERQTNRGEIVYDLATW